MTNVSYDPRAVLIDGQRTFLLSGAIHYPRSTPAMWPELMRQGREAGLNTIETYVFWNLHEQKRGVFDFSDRLDLLQFCKAVQEAGLYLILRIGPYICAEINYGGLPAWLREVPGMQTRTNNQLFMAEMERWVRLLCDYLRPMFASNGGPIILAQIENEYDLIARNYGAEGQRYLEWAIQLGQSLNLGIPWVMCVGGMPGAIETVNGFYGHQHIEAHFERHPDQPALWTENWPGWYDTWGYPHHIRTPQNVAYAVSRFVAAGGTGVNYYMWHGGTNFGREAMFLQTTSYDYHAPLDEFGLPTTKSAHVARLHQVVRDHANTLLSHQRPTPHALGPAQSAYVYGDLAFLCNDDPAETVTVGFENQDYQLASRAVLIISGGQVVFNTSIVNPADEVQRSMIPLENAVEPFAWWAEPLPNERDAALQTPVIVEQPIEQLQLTHDETDYCWYTTQLEVSAKKSGHGLLEIDGVADVVHVFIDGYLVTTTKMPLHEDRGPFNGPAFRQEFDLTISEGTHELSFLCCGLGLIKGDWQIGHQNMVDEKKGFWETAYWKGTKLRNPWTLRPAMIGELCGIYGNAGGLLQWNTSQEEGAGRPLRWWRTTFARPAGDTPLALDLTGMNKGLAWLNGRCIGRYWLTPGSAASQPWLIEAIEDTAIGAPTQRYYHLPLEWLRDTNTLVLFEELGGDPSNIRICARM